MNELLDSLREIEGFPKGKDKDILSLSEPPFYTACPNPYIKDYIEEYGKKYDEKNDDYNRKPYIGDLSENKNDPLSNAHYYITKVPYKAIMRLLLHYTNPGDIVFDGFCGSGMLGLASQLCQDPPYEIKKKFNEDNIKINWGRRYAILSELSTLGSFISRNYNTKVDVGEFENIANKILSDVSKEYDWVYETLHEKEHLLKKEKDSIFQFEVGNIKGKINHILWSDKLICSYCQNEFIYWNAAMDFQKKKLLDEFECPNCNAKLKKSECEKAKFTFFDSGINKNVTQIKQIPVIINYSIGKKRYEKIPSEYDLNIIQQINDAEIPNWYPINEIPRGDKTSEPIRMGITHVHHFYSKRNLLVLSSFLDKILSITNKKIRNKLLFIITSLWLRASKKAVFSSGNYFHGGGGYITTISGNMYIPSIFAEVPIIEQFSNRLKKTNIINKHPQIIDEGAIISSSSSTNLRLIPDNSVDYIFIDPPFGSNLMYSELNFVAEAWLKVLTNNFNEAVINRTQNKNLEDYTILMTKCLKEMFRILKPNRWITVEFHNSKASVWNAIQVSLSRSGFIVAQVAVLDKQSGSYTSYTSFGAVENDLIITAYKPKKDFSDLLIKKAGKNMELDFTNNQLEHLPIRPNIERTEKMLYSKMLAHYVENGFKIRYNSTNFYKLLSDNFIELDSNWFLDSQVNEYNDWKNRLTLDQIKDVFEGQQILFITDEKSALTWLFHFLNRPKTYNEIYTAYQQIATTTEDKIPEIRVILDNNFILEGGKYRRPLTQQEKEEKNKNRERELDRAFSNLLQQAEKTQKEKIKTIRREALIYGFTKCYQQDKYDDILTIADKLHSSVLESSGEIMDFIDIARIKTSGKKKIEDF